MSVRFHPTSPCSTCPYRKDAKLRHWHRSEFEKLLEDELPGSLGRVYACHKQADVKPTERGFCAGWLLDQKKRNLPSIMLRIDLIKRPESGAALEAVNDGGHELFSAVKEMCRMNGVRLKKKRGSLGSMRSMPLQDWSKFWDRPGHVEDEESIPEVATSADDKMKKILPKSLTRKGLTRHNNKT